MKKYDVVVAGARQRAAAVHEHRQERCAAVDVVTRAGVRGRGQRRGRRRRRGNVRPHRAAGQERRDQRRPEAAE